MGTETILCQNISGKLSNWFLQKIKQDKLQTGIEEARHKRPIVFHRSFRPEAEDEIIEEKEEKKGEEKGSLKENEEEKKGEEQVTEK